MNKNRIKVETVTLLTAVWHFYRNTDPVILKPFFRAMISRLTMVMLHAYIDFTVFIWRSKNAYLKYAEKCTMLCYWSILLQHTRAKYEKDKSIVRDVNISVINVGMLYKYVGYYKIMMGRCKNSALLK